MSKLLRSITAAIAALQLLLMFWVTSAYSAEMPKSWPWVGVTVNNLSFTPKDLVILKTKLPRMNSIRLTLLARQTAQRKRISPSEAWLDMTGWTHKMLDVCREQGIVAVISINQFPLDPATDINQNSLGFWSSPVYRREAVIYVKQMAKEFASRGDELIAFEVLSEPLVITNKRHQLPDEWSDLMREIVSTIRIHSNKWIVVTPGLGGIPGGYANFKPLDEQRIVYGAHMYEPWSFTLQGIGDNRPIGASYPGMIGLTYWDKKQIANVFNPLRVFQEKYQVPVWIGEFSAARWANGSNQYILDVIGLCNSYSWGWAFFNMGGFHGWDPDYDSNYPTKENPARKIGQNSERWLTLDSVLGER